MQQQTSWEMKDEDKDNDATAIGWWWIWSQQQPTQTQQAIAKDKTTIWKTKAKRTIISKEIGCKHKKKKNSKIDFALSSQNQLTWRF